jgi:iron(III) transport system substrate-binding protein
MVENDVQIYEDNTSIRDAIAAGEIDYGLINHYYVEEARAEEGEDYPVGIHEPDGGDTGALVNVAGVGTIAGSDQEEAAQDFARFLLSEEAQQFFASETKEYPLAAGVEPEGQLEPLADIEQPDVELTDLDDLEGTTELLERTGAL